MEEKLNLALDEFVIIREVNVAHGSDITPSTDELILTNKRIICLHKGIFGGLKATYAYQLDKIKVFNGVPQVKKGQLSYGADSLDIYFVDGEEQFNFQNHNKRTIAKWIEEIYSLFGCEVEGKNKSRVKRNKRKVEIDDESVSTAFKEIGDEFRGVGKEVVSTFGSVLRELDIVGGDDVNAGNEATEFNYQLESDETVILSNNRVRIAGDMEQIGDALLLTNEKIVIEYTTSGIFTSQKHIDIFELSDIKKYKGMPQVKMGKYHDYPALDVFFNTSHLIFQFASVGNKKKQSACIERWIEKINMLVSEFDGEGDSSSPKKICRNCGAEIDVEAAFCTCCGAKYVGKDDEVTACRICSQCGSKIDAGLKFCTECGTPVELDGTPETDGALADQEEQAASEGRQATHDKKVISISQQIELLEKLKALVDAGILSQEEFEQKKKEILRGE